MFADSLSKEPTMSDRALRFAARMIAVGLLGVAWTIGTVAMVLVQLDRQTEGQWQARLLGYAGMAPVAVLLIYVIVTDLADWRRTSKQQADDDE
jgi:hypothetical protein